MWSPTDKEYVYFMSSFYASCSEAELELFLS